MASRRRERKGLWQHIVQEWPATILVTALVTLIAFHPASFAWFRAIDRYAYVVIGHLSTRLNPVPAAGSKSSSPRLAIVQIDQDTYKSQYYEQAPLNRCKLHDDLLKIYQSRPNTVVVDLDLSPAREPVDPRRNYGWAKQSECQHKLDSLIRNQVSNKRIATVLAAPFDETWTLEQKEWACKMEQASVRFGSAKLPVEYGVALTHYVEASTLAQGVKGRPNNSIEQPACNAKCLRGGCANGNRNDRYMNPFEPSDARRAVLNFTAYAALDPPTIELAKWPLNADELLRDAIVFFGAAYGDDDVYLTPMDEKYGVELHAMAFVSTLKPVYEGDSFLGRLGAFVEDLLWGFAFGFVIATCWHHYFVLRFDVNSALSPQRASMWIFILFGGVVILLIVVLWVSLLSLTNYEIWASPVPIAVGVAFEIFVSGRVPEALHVPQKRLNLLGSIKKFAYLDCSCLWRKNEQAAAILVGLRRVVWLGFVVWAFVSMFSG